MKKKLKKIIAVMLSLVLIGAFSLTAYAYDETIPDEGLTTEITEIQVDNVDNALPDEVAPAPQEQDPEQEQIIIDATPVEVTNFQEGADSTLQPEPVIPDPVYNIVIDPEIENGKLYFGEEDTLTVQAKEGEEISVLKDLKNFFIHARNIFPGARAVFRIRYLIYFRHLLILKKILSNLMTDAAYLLCSAEALFHRSMKVR